MPLGSYHVISRNKYITPPSFVKVSPKEIAPENIKSGIPDPPSVGSYGHAPQTVIFKNGVFITKTSNNTFETTARDFYRNGPVTQIDDYRFGSWIKAGTENYPNRESNNPIPKMPNVAYVTGITPLGMFFSNKYDTQVDLKTTPRIIEAIDPNKTGYFDSIVNANLYQLLRSSMFDNANRLSEEATAWIDFLAKKGYSIDKSKNSEIFALGTETDSTKQGYLAFYYPGLGILGTEEHFHDKVKKLSERYGLTEREAVEAMKRAIIFHETAHRLGVSGDDAGEHLQGKLQEEFYSMLAQKYKGTKKGRVYDALRREGEDYARGYEKSLATIITQLFDIKGKRKSRMDFLIAKFAAEAEALELPYHLREVYIKSRLKETAGPLYEDVPANEYSEGNLEALVSKEIAEARDVKTSKTDYKESVERVVAKARKTKIYRESKDSGEAYETAEKSYERRISKSEYRNMKDVREREARSERVEKAEPEAKEAEAQAE